MTINYLDSKRLQGLSTDEYKIHSFTTVGNTNFIVTTGSGTVEYLVIAGGGGGGGGLGGGGGAGGFRTGTLPVSTPSSITVTQTTGGDFGNVYESHQSAHGLKLETASAELIGYTLNTFDCWLRKQGSPTGTGTARIYNGVGTLMETSTNTLNVSTLTGTSTQTSFTFAGTHTLEENDRIVFFWNGGNNSNYIQFEHATTNVYDSTDTIRTRYASSAWDESLTTTDAKFIIVTGAATVIPITVGDGGAASSSTGSGGQGDISVFDTITASGGGYGGGEGLACNSGGSGGGSGITGSGAGCSGNTGAFTPSEGNAGGTNSGGYNGKCGGGGSSATGGTTTPNHNGTAGGAGTANPISGSKSGVLSGGVYYLAAGGGGAGLASLGGNAGSGGLGGGGDGGTSSSGGNGTTNTGSGGGGGGEDGGNRTGGSGGSGIVIIRYLNDGSITATGGDTTYAKPTNVQTNSLFEQTDTNTRHWYDGTNWITQPTFEDDFSSDNWTDSDTKISVSNGVMNWNCKRDGSNDASVYDLTSTATNWVLRFKLVVTSVSGSTQAGNGFYVGLSDSNQTVGQSTSQDFIGMSIYNDNTDTYRTIDADNTTVPPIGSGDSSQTTTYSNGSTYYYQIIKSGSSYTVEGFTNSDYSTGSTGLITGTSSASGLRYLKIFNDMANIPTSTNPFQGTIDDLKFYNGVTSV